jgi:hypothetical protein
MNNDRKLKSTRRLLILFIVCLFLSGLSAIPVHTELAILEQLFSRVTWVGLWLNKVHLAYNEVTTQYPFLFYGYDWLAFAHFILAILFIGPYRDPIRNIWVIQFGLIACVLVIPFAFIAGSLRGIPIGWRLIDCSFGVVGYFFLSVVFKKTNSIQIALIKPSII